MFKFFGKRKTQPAQPRVSRSLHFMGMPTAGEPVDDVRAFNYSAFWACQRIISETIAYVPWHVYGQESKRKYLSGHSLDSVIYRRPNEEMSAFTFKELMFQHGTGWGNFVAEVERNRANQVVNLWPLEPGNFEIARDNSGRLYYEYAQPNGPNKTLKARDVYHMRGPSRDGLMGYSVIDIARESISLGLAAESFGSAFFGNGAMPATVIMGSENTDINEEGIKNLLSTWRKKHQGPRKSHKVEYLEHGFDVKQLSISPEDAQFLETRKFQVSEMARWFRIPPHKLADLERSTHNNIESQNIEFVTDAIMPWVSRAESEANFRLLDDSDLYTKFNILGLLRGDSKARSEYYKTLSSLGVFTIDDILSKEDMDPLGGDVGQMRMVPVNMTTPEVLLKGETAAQSRSSGSASAVAADQARRFCEIECKRMEKILERPPGQMEEQIRNFYVEHAKTLSNGFYNISKMVLECIDKPVEGLNGKLESYFSNYCADSADEAHNAAIKGESKRLIARWKSSKATKLCDNFLTYLAES